MVYKMNFAEVFGFPVESETDEAKNARELKLCPFRGNKCTKVNASDPLGICSLKNESHAAVICPVRFIEGLTIFKDAANIAFGENCEVGIFPEVHILEVKKTENNQGKKIGKVDFLIAKIVDGTIEDFAAVEVQASYISGRSIRPAFDDFIGTGLYKPELHSNRCDFRSSAQKRLVPQLRLKLPVFRRWGKKFFVVCDSLFFAELPVFETCTQANSELTWLSYEIETNIGSYKLGVHDAIFSGWEEVSSALREGTPPEPSQIILELQNKFDRGDVVSFSV